jgi:hypothetical protein
LMPHSLTSEQSRHGFLDYDCRLSLRFFDAGMCAIFQFGLDVSSLNRC